MANRFYLYEEQSGGCDYTIGCGRRLRRMPPGIDSIQQATKWAFEEIGDEGITKAMVLEVVNGTEIDLPGLERERRRVKEEMKKLEQERKEKAEYERLKAKYG